MTAPQPGSELGVTQMRWPVEIAGIDQSDSNNVSEVTGQAVWRDDRQSFAILMQTSPLEDDGRDRSASSQRLAWIGDQHGQFPTMAALETELASRDIQLGMRSQRNLGQLAAIAKETVGPARLVGNKRHGEAVLAVVHPDESVTRLEPGRKLSADGFNWGYRGHGTLETADAGLRAAVGDKTSDEELLIGAMGPHRTDLVGTLLAALPDEFALPLDELAEWIRSRRPFSVQSYSPSTQRLDRDINERGVVLPERVVERSPLGRTR